MISWINSSIYSVPSILLSIMNKSQFQCVNCSTISLLKKNCMGKYCNNKCQKENEQKISFKEVEDGLAKNSAQVKRYLLHKFGNVCSVCKISSWQDKPISMEIEHIDGNHQNNVLTNCCLICPNCHSQTPTYKAKNKGRGRHSRMQRYHDGKSY